MVSTWIFDLQVTESEIKYSVRQIFFRYNTLYYVLNVKQQLYNRNEKCNAFEQQKYY